LGAGIALRLRASVGGYGHAADLGAFQDWAERAWDSRLAFFYGKIRPTDCPPGYAVVLALLGGLRSLFALQKDSPGFELLVRLPALACDLGIALLAYRVVGERAGKARGLLACAAFILNPLAIMDSAAWGQVDSVFCLALVASIVCLEEDKPLRSGILYGLAILAKPLALFFAPVFLCRLWSRRKPKGAALLALSCLGTLLSGFLPYMPASGAGFPFEYLASSFKAVPFAT